MPTTTRVTTIIAFITLSLATNAQVGIGTETPVLDLEVIDSTDVSQLRLMSATSGADLILDAETMPLIKMMSAGISKARIQWQANTLKMFSAPPDTIFVLGNPVLISNPTLTLSEDKYLGINVGFAGTPSEALHVNGRIKMGYSDLPATAGTMRFNALSSNFEGYDGSNWKTLGGELVDADADTRVYLTEAAKDSIVFQTDTDDLMAFDGHRLSLGKNGNTIIGHNSTHADVPGNIGNTVLGWLSGSNLVSGVSNTSLGFWAGHDLTTGDYNTLLGTDAGRKLVIGSSNTLLGYRAGYNTLGTGNVFIGYRAGADETGSDKLYIANSPTAYPLIYGEFQTSQVDINGSLEVIGDQYVDEDLFVNENLHVVEAVTVESYVESPQVNLNSGSNATLDFKQSGSSKYYIRHNAGSDRLEIHETGVGDIIRIEDGDIYFPQLAGSDQPLSVDASGKLEAGALVEHVRISGLAFSEDYFTGSTFYIYDLNPHLQNGVTIDSFTARLADESSSNTDVDVYVRRYSRITTGLPQNMFSINVAGATLSDTIFEEYTTSTVITSNSNDVDLDNWVYFLQFSDNFQSLSDIREVTVHLSQ